MTTLEDTIKQYKQQVVKIRRETDERIREIENHITRLEKRKVRLDAEKLNTCPDCANRGWLYDENGNRLHTCPCHF